MSPIFPFNETSCQKRHKILCWESFAVCSQTKSPRLWVRESCISLAAKLTESPKTEYSLLDPEVPTTPVNTVPVEIPIEQLQLSLAS